jgi:hypothetical protein
LGALRRVVGSKQGACLDVRAGAWSGRGTKPVNSATQLRIQLILKPDLLRAVERRFFRSFQIAWISATCTWAFRGSFENRRCYQGGTKGVFQQASENCSMRWILISVARGSGINGLRKMELQLVRGLEKDRVRVLRTGLRKSVCEVPALAARAGSFQRRAAAAGYNSEPGGAAPQAAPPGGGARER